MGVRESGAGTLTSACLCRTGRLIKQRRHEAINSSCLSLQLSDLSFSPPFCPALHLCHTVFLSEHTLCDYICSQMSILLSHPPPPSSSNQQNISSSLPLLPFSIPCPRIPFPLHLSPAFCSLLLPSALSPRLNPLPFQPLPLLLGSLLYHSISFGSLPATSLSGALSVSDVVWL